MSNHLGGCRPCKLRHMNLGRSEGCLLASLGGICCWRLQRAVAWRTRFATASASPWTSGARRKEKMGEMSRRRRGRFVLTGWWKFVPGSHLLTTTG